MRIGREKPLSDSIHIFSKDVADSSINRKLELAAMIQAALKVGADLGARELGRKAFAEFLKLEKMAFPKGVTASASGEMLFAYAKPSRRRPSV